MKFFTIIFLVLLPVILARHKKPHKTTKAPEHHVTAKPTLSCTGSGGGSTVKSELLKIKALNRPFHLGALYDARAGKLLAPGLSFWKKERLHSPSYLQAINVSSSTAKTTGLMTYKQKMDAFSIDVGFMVTYLIFMFGGSVSYMQEKGISELDAGRVFSYERKTHEMALTMDHLSCVDYPDMAKQVPEATHFVSAVEYGASDLLQVKQQCHTQSEAHDFGIKITAGFNFFIGSISGTVGGSVGWGTSSGFDDINVDYYGDTPLTYPPLTLAQFANATASIGAGLTRDTAIPIAVHLMPISAIVPQTEAEINEIDTQLMALVQERLAALNKLSGRVETLKTNLVYAQMQSIRQKIDEFGDALDTNIDAFHVQAANAIAAVKGGTASASILSTLLNTNQQHGIALPFLNNYVTSKQVEMSIMSTLLIEPTSVSLGAGSMFFSTPAAFFKQLYSPQVTHVFTLTIGVYDTETVDEITDCLQNNCTSSVSYSSWMNDGAFMSSLRSHSTSFRTFIDTNAGYMSDSRAYLARETKLSYFSNGKRGVAFEVFASGDRISNDYTCKTCNTVTVSNVTDQVHSSDGGSCSAPVVGWLAKNAKYVIGYSISVRLDSGNTTSPWNSSISASPYMLSPQGSYDMVMSAYCQDVDLKTRVVCSNVLQVTPQKEKTGTVALLSASAKSLTTYSPTIPRESNTIDLPSAVQLANGFAASAFSGVIFVIGGHNAQHPFQIYNAQNESWVYKNMPGPTEARYNHGTVVANNSLLAIGGLDNKSGKTLATVELFTFTFNATNKHPSNVTLNFEDNLAHFKQASAKPVKSIWASISPMSTPRSQITPIAAQNQNKEIIVVVIGGYNGGNTVTQQSAESYNFITKSWSALELPLRPRYNYGAALVDDGKHSNIMVCGGYVSGKPSNTCDVLNTMTGKWSTSAPLPAAGVGGSLISLNGQLFMIGMSTSMGNDQVFSYNDAAKKWETACVGTNGKGKAPAAAMIIDSQQT